MTGESPLPPAADPNDATRPIVTPARIIPFAGDLLDRTKSNWLTWSSGVKDDLDMCRLGSHILPAPDCDPPDSTIHPNAYQNWLLNDRAARAFLNKGCSEVEKDLLTNIKTARDCWVKLEALHTNEGPVRQAQLIQGVVGKKFARSADMVDTARAQLKDMSRAFKMPGGLSEDTFISVILLMNLGAGLEHIRANIQRDMQAATKAKPYSPSSIISYLEHERQLVLSDTNTDATTSIALAATNSSGRGTPAICTNCKRARHTAKYCVQTGGGMAGKSIEESKAQRLLDNSASGNSKGSGAKPAGGNANSTGATAPGPSSGAKIPPGKLPAVHIDANNRAYIVYVDAPPTDTASFAGFPSINVDSPDFTPGDDFEVVTSTDNLEVLDSAFAMLGIFTDPNDFSAPIDWNVNVRSIDEAHVGAEPLSITACPFHCDSAASCHLSPERRDFVNLRPVIGRRVRGLNGSVVTASGIGDINLLVAQDTYLTLRDVLYIPQAMVRLISVGCLAEDSKLNTNFSDTGFEIVHKTSGAVRASGTRNRTSKLYELDIHVPTEPAVESAYAASSIDTLHTWHLRLGHAHYSVVQAMAREGRIRGMSPTMASALPPKCDSCILGKQTRTSVPKKRQEGPGHNNLCCQFHVSNLGSCHIMFKYPQRATAQGPGQLPNSPFQARKIVCASLAWHDIGQLPTGMVRQVAEFEK